MTENKKREREGPIKKERDPNPRPVSSEIHGEGAPSRANLEVPIDFARARLHGARGGAESVRDGVLAVEALGGLPRLEHEPLEAVVRATPRVPPRLSRRHALGEVVEVAALERQARAPQGFVAASSGPEGGQKPVAKIEVKVAANPDAIDLDDEDL